MSSISSTSLMASSTSTTLALEKPLGIILEEVSEGEAMGVLVESVTEDGSASAYKDTLVGLKISKIMNEDVGEFHKEQDVI